ncbi:MAG: TIGR03936 family radical SAM-associated protein [Clostridia bacterium]|nr:TIGR03936 family radical SAM-associated protein [Clostridia bacterium]
MKQDAIKIRITFRKTAAVRYVSHLDMMRAFKRALRRSGLPIVYTEGFNVHPVMIFTPPLSVGYLSECELLDIGLTKDVPLKDILSALCRSLPEGFMATEVKYAKNKISDIYTSVYEIASPELLGKKEAFLSFAAEKEIIISRSTKGGEKTVDCAPFIKNAAFEEDGKTAKITLTLPSNNDISVNPRLVIEEFMRREGVAASPDYKRIALLDKNGNSF